MGNSTLIKEDKGVPQCKNCGSPCQPDGNITKLGFKRYRHYCGQCFYIIKKNKGQIKPTGKARYRRYKKDKCELCGFIPINSCQLDVDHIDGNKQNKKESNFQTLCANCHRLKTFLNKDGTYKIINHPNSKNKLNLVV
jgi:hypothetical protein